MGQPPATVGSGSAGLDLVMPRWRMEPEVCQEPWVTAFGGCCGGTLRASRFASGAERFQAFRRTVRGVLRRTTRKRKELFAAVLWAECHNITHDAAVVL